MEYKLSPNVSTTFPDSDGILDSAESVSKFLNVTAEQVLQDVGMIKASNKNEKVVPGISYNPTRSFTEHPAQVYTNKGVRELYRPITFQTLREVERKNPVVSACTNLRRRQMRPFATRSMSNDEPGFQIVLKDPEAKPNAKDKKVINAISDWFENTGYTDFPGWEDREDNLLDAMTKIVQDFMVIDQVALELRRDKKGRVLDFHVIDGATIRRVSKLSGYRGGKSDFDPRSYIPMDNEIQRRMYEAKIELIPDIDNIAFVQEINGRYLAAFTHQDLIFEQLQKRTDLRFAGYGYSPLEQAMNAITAFLFAVAYNAEAFNSGTIPKIALAFKDGNFSEEQLIALQSEWLANFQGIKGAWRIPILNREVQTIDLLKSPRDMEYGKYLDTMGSLICSVLGVDPAEIGLKFQQGQNVMFENQGARLHFSKDRALNDLLGGIANMFNMIMRQIGWSDKYKFIFTGIEPEDAKEKSQLRSEAVKRDKTVNELRAEQDLPPDPYGDIILDPTYLQYRQSKEAESQAGGSEDFGNEEMGGAVDEAVDDIFKAQNPNSVKLLLK